MISISMRPSCSPDLLFPLEAMGMGLRYDPGPKLAFHVRTLADVEKLTGGAEQSRSS